MVAAVLVSTGWSAYLVNFLRIMGVNVPQSLAASPWDHDPGLFNLPAVLIVAVLTALLVRGIRESSRVNLVIVVFKLAVIVFFIAVAGGHVHPENWRPFLPFGMGGVLRAAAIVFLAYVGFDAVSTAAEEAVNPQRDMPIGIVGSLVVATVLYIVVAAIMTGIVPYTELGVADPVALVLNRLAMPWGSVVVSIGAMAGITSVLLVLLLGQPRILFAMSRDGLLPPFLAKVHPRFGTPHLTTMATGAIVATAAALTPIDVSSELCSIGTLFAFIIVCAGVIVLRYVRPEIPRPFRTPLFPVLPAVGILACALLMVNLPFTAWERFVVWLVIGLLLYFAYGRRNSRLARAS
jgi:APA family basic amino acid/polyamine antiporter